MAVVALVAQCARAGVPAEVVQFIARRREFGPADGATVRRRGRVAVHHGERVFRLARWIECDNVGKLLRRRRDGGPRAAVEGWVRSSHATDDPPRRRRRLPFCKNALTNVSEPVAAAGYCADMLHLRVITPAELRESVIDLLTANPGVTHLVIHRGAAIDPSGDEITADIARESANDVIEGLKALGVKERGAITLDVVDTVLSTRAYRAEDEAAGDPADAVVWDELAARTREESTLNAAYLAFLCLACLIAAVGVVNDSPVTVVGAMVVGPEFGPLAALAVALVRRRAYLARRAAVALFVGFPVAMLVTAVGVLAGEALGWITLQSTRQLSEVDFIF